MRRGFEAGFMIGREERGGERERKREKREREGKEGERDWKNQRNGF